MDFPTSPASGTMVTDGTRNWVWNGAAWDLFVNLGQINMVFTPVFNIVEVTIAALPSPISGTWTLLTYI